MVCLCGGLVSYSLVFLLLGEGVCIYIYIYIHIIIYLSARFGASWALRASELEKTKRKFASKLHKSKKLEESLLQSLRTRENLKEACFDASELETNQRILASKPQNSIKFEDSEPERYSN